ncbi:hypothetical protein K439DRAFT_1611786 [Ramaria rubella]|nr:hypothetical protein K439DRAFT_1611786 [Ramaria rubella]
MGCGGDVDEFGVGYTVGEQGDAVVGTGDGEEVQVRTGDEVAQLWVPRTMCGLATTSAQLLVIVVVVERDDVARSCPGVHVGQLLLLCSALSPLTFSSITFSNSASMRDTAHVRVVVGVGSVSERVLVVWLVNGGCSGMEPRAAAGSQGGVGCRETVTRGAVDCGVEPCAAAGGRDGMGHRETAMQGWWHAHVHLGMYGGCVVAVGTAWGVRARRSAGMKG